MMQVKQHLPTSPLRLSMILLLFTIAVPATDQLSALMAS